MPQVIPPENEAVRSNLVNAIGTYISARAVDLAAGYGPALPMARLTFLLLGFIEVLGGLPETLTDEAVSTLVHSAIDDTDMQHLSLVMYAVCWRASVGFVVGARVVKCAALSVRALHLATRVRAAIVNTRQPVFLPAFPCIVMRH